MRALWLDNQKLELRTDIPQPIPADYEALIKVRMAGVCSTDLELLRGYYPFSGIPGHEFVGEVVSSTEDASWIGKRVVGEINIACGVCRTCKSGLPRHCENRKALGIHNWNGAFAEYLVLPLVNLHAVPDSISDEQAVFTEPLAAAYEILEQVQVHPRDMVLIIGAGRLGQLVARVLQTTGCQLVVAARHPRQRELLERQNIRTINAARPDEIKYDIVIEATGSPEGYLLARGYVRPHGTIVLKSTYKGDVLVNLSGIVVDEVSLVGSRCGPFEPALRLLEQGIVDPRPLIDSLYPLVQGVIAFEQAAQPGVLKILIQPG